MNIFSQYLQPVRSITERMADLDAQDMNRERLTGARQQNALQALAMRKSIDADAQAREDQNILRNLYTESGGDPNKIIDLARRTARPGLASYADSLEKALLERKKTEAAVNKDNATTDQTKQATDAARRKELFQNVAMLSSPNDALQLLNDTGSQLPPPMRAGIESLIRTDPKWQVKLMLGIADPSKMIDVLTPHMQTNNTGGQTVTQAFDKLTGMPIATSAVKNTQSPDNAASTGTQMAVARMADARQREANDLTREANANVYDAERGILVNRATGLARPAATMDGTPVGSKDKPLTDAQAKAALFGSRMQASDKILADLASEGTKASVPFSRAPVIGNAVTALSPAKQQQLDQAKRDFVNAVLRRESGAVISPSEFENADKQYFPQIGDSPEVISQKANNRAIAIRGMQAEVPNAEKVFGKIIKQEDAPSKSNAPAKISGDAEYNALPSGATFIGPDGKTRRKP